MKPFSNSWKELAVEEGCILWGIRVVVLGAVQMKSLAWGHIWWPGVDQEVEEMIKACMACQEVKNTHAVTPLNPWIWPDTP